MPAQSSPQTGTVVPLAAAAAAASAAAAAGFALAHLTPSRRSTDRGGGADSEVGGGGSVGRGGGGGSDARFEVPRELRSPDCPYREELEVAVGLALRAGENMRRHCDDRGTTDGRGSERTLGISTKSSSADFATDIDVLNEKIIGEGIRSRFPSHEIIGEETVGTGSVPPLTDAPTWIIDPIDGTANFASGLPLTAVSIGLCVGGRPVMGVAYAPMTGEIYAAVKGRGSYRNGRRIRSVDPTASERTMSNAVVCYEFGYARSDASVGRMVGAAARVLSCGCRSTRQTGCGVLDICYVASGRMDVVYTGVADEGWKPWDYCAAMVIAEEAGCTIRSLRGRPGGSATEEFDAEGRVVDGSYFDIYSTSMICGVNKSLVEECRRVVLDL